MMWTRALLISTVALLAVAAAPVATAPSAPSARLERRDASAVASPTEQWRPAVAAAREYARSRSGVVSFSVRTDDRRAWHEAGARTVPAASVMKVMFLAAYLRHPAVRDRPLRDRDRDLLRPMIRRSANAEASQIADMVGPDRINRLARRAGMRDFSYTRPWGASRISARDQSRFLLRLRRHIPQRHERYAVQLLTRVIDEQRWGIGEVATPGWTQHFKGGWGSGSGAVDHQVVRLRRHDGSRIGLAVMTTGSPSHAYATTTLRGVFRRLLRDLP